MDGEAAMGKRRQMCWGPQEPMSLKTADSSTVPNSPGSPMKKWAPLEVMTSQKGCRQDELMPNMGL